VSNRGEKDPGEIELFFKALKQNLKVKGFVGTRENALRIQIWTVAVEPGLYAEAEPHLLTAT